MTHSQFDRIIERRLSGSRKWDGIRATFGSDSVLPMWIADMDFTSPPEVVEAVRQRAEHGVFGYPTRGEDYYAAIINWVGRRQGWVIQPEWICHTPGVVPAISAAVQSFTDPGDSVIIQPPVYPPFFSCVINNGRKLVENPLRLVNGRYEMDFADLAAKLTPDVKMMVICSPHNPVGRVWTEAELQQLVSLCYERGVIIVADEIHGDLVFPGYRQIPLATVSPEAAAIAITCIAPSKTFNIAGLYESAIIIADPGRRKRFNATLQAIDIGGGNVFGIAALQAAYRHGAAWLDELMPYLADNAKYLAEGINELAPPVKMIKPESTFLAWLDFRELGMDAAELRQFLIHEAKLGLNDGKTFGLQGEGFARLNFGCPRSLLSEALVRLARAVKRLKGKG